MSPNLPSKKIFARSRNRRSHVFTQFEKLAEDPFPRQAVKLEAASDLFRVRVGDYRVVYEVDRDGKQVIIHHVRHRRDVYKRL